PDQPRLDAAHATFAYGMQPLTGAARRPTVGSMLTLDEWLSSGERVKVDVPSGSFAVFCRTQGSGPWLTFLHSFPTSSWDWAKVADNLAEGHRCLFIDFLGFGDSDKPSGHDYRLTEQADIVDALWRHYGVDETGLIAHDYGGSVAQELLARQSA